MKGLREQFDKILRDFTGASYGFNETIDHLINAVEDHLKQVGKQGGLIRKKQNPDYSAIGKKGLEKRWGKCKVCDHIHKEVCKCGCPAVRETL